MLADEGLHTYHFRKVLALAPEDDGRRTVFCWWLLRQDDEDERFLSNVLWPDDSQWIGKYTQYAFGGKSNSTCYVSNQLSASVLIKSGGRNTGNRITGLIMLPNIVTGNDISQFLTNLYK